MEVTPSPTLTATPAVEESTVGRPLWEMPPHVRPEPDARVTGFQPATLTFYDAETGPPVSTITDEMRERGASAPLIDEEYEAGQQARIEAQLRSVFTALTDPIHPTLSGWTLMQPIIPSVPEQIVKLQVNDEGAPEPPTVVMKFGKKAKLKRRLAAWRDQVADLCEYATGEEVDEDTPFADLVHVVESRIQSLREDLTWEKDQFHAYTKRQDPERERLREALEDMRLRAERAETGRKAIEDAVREFATLIDTTGPELRALVRFLFAHFGNDFNPNDERGRVIARKLSNWLDRAYEKTRQAWQLVGRAAPATLVGDPAACAAVRATV